MRKSVNAVLMSAAITLGVGVTSASAGSSSLGYLPMIDTSTQTCYLPRKEIWIEDEFISFETTRVVNCGAVVEPQEDDETLRGWASVTRSRPGAAGVGPTLVVFESADYPDVPCVIKTGFFRYHLTFDWKTTIVAVPGGTRHNITCQYGEEVEEEELKAMGISVK